MTQDELSDWPDSDQENKFKRMPKHKRTKLVHGFHAGLESGSLREKGLFEKNTVDIYPEVKSMTITGSKNKDSLYTTGDLEHGSGISSPVIRGFTRDMRVPNLEGTNFDNMKVSKKYGKPYVPLTEKEKEDLMKNVWDSKYNYNKELDLLFAREQTEKDPETGLKGHLVRANRPVPVISGDDFDNMQSAGKSRKRSTRRRQTKHKKRSKRKTRKSTNKKKNKKTRSKKQKGGNRDYVLYLAARQGSVDIVINMLEQGADINWTKNSGCTPLHIASQNGHVEVVSVLLEQGPDIDKATDDGCTPLYLASQNGCVDVVRMLLEHRADIDKAANDGCTPLSIASYKGRVKVVRMLLEQGADINKARDNGATPLFTASQNGRVEMVRMLLEHGADIDKANDNGITPLMIAEGDGHSEVATLLKRYKLLRPIVEKTVERQKERKHFEEMMENKIFGDFKNKHEMMQYLGGRRKTRKHSQRNKKRSSRKK